MIRFWLSLLAALLVLPSAMPAAQPPVPKVDAVKGQFIVFVQPKDSALAREFTEKHLPELMKRADDLGADLRIVDVNESGAPAEVAVTPLIAFQNYKGRSIFQGRYADYGKVAHFIKTSRAVPQGDAENVKENVPVLELGRAVVITPVKITPLEDIVPPGFDQQAFHDRARKALSKGFTRLRETERVAARRTDRLFYMDFYPFGAENGQLVVLMALFSQFNCHEAVYTEYNDVVMGKMEEADALFAKAAGILEAEMLRQMKESKLGDGFDPINSSVPVRSWASLDLNLPLAPAHARFNPKPAQPLVADWVFDPMPVDEAPPLQFRFPAPLDNYMGSAPAIDAELHLADGLKLVGASGFVEVSTTSLTLGEKELDATMLNAIKAADFASARFDLKEIAAPENHPLAYGDMRQFLGKGNFLMKGVTTPIDVRAEITPTVNDEGAPRLQVTAEFSIRLREKFAIDGPPGPEPANDTVEFRLSFQMKPATSPGPPSL